MAAVATVWPATYRSLRLDLSLQIHNVTTNIMKFIKEYTTNITWLDLDM